MRNVILFTMALLLCTAITNAQAPQGFNYQAVIRDGSGNLITSGTVSMRFSLLVGSSSGALAYQETQSVTPNGYGLVTAVIGGGAVVTGTFNTLAWGSNTYYLMVEADPTGGNSYVSLGTPSQFQSVPYALSLSTPVNLVDKGTGDQSGAFTYSAPNATKIGASFTSTGGQLFLGAYNNSTWPGVLNNGALISNQNTAGDMAVGTGGTGKVVLYTDNNFTSPAVTVNGGFVGIGSYTPKCPLDVETSNGGSNGSRAITFFEQSNASPALANNSSWTASSNISANFAGNVLCGISFIATSGSYYSDIRYKNVIGLSNSANDLKLLNQIKITEYKYKDEKTLGSKVQKKLIAQELEQILPSAVGRTVNYIPNVYALACEVKTKDNGLQFDMDTVHGLAVGDKIKWISTDGEIHYNKVTTVLSDKSFVLDAADKVSGAFVYGKEVNDFRTVDYEAVSMLNVSATQELAKKVASLEKENAALKAQLQSNGAVNSELKAQVQSSSAAYTLLKNDVDAIKAQLCISSQMETK